MSEESIFKKERRTGAASDSESQCVMDKPNTRAQTAPCSGKTAAGLKHMCDTG